jgi:hypothetical protein
MILTPQKSYREPSKDGSFGLPRTPQVSLETGMPKCYTDRSVPRWDAARAMKDVLIGVNPRGECITVHYKGPGVMKGVGDPLQVVQEARSAACSECSAKEVDREGRQTVGSHEQKT